jgi:hypothetical protein
MVTQPVYLEAGVVSGSHGFGGPRGLAERALLGADIALLAAVGRIAWQELR